MKASLGRSTGYVERKRTCERPLSFIFYERGDQKVLRHLPFVLHLQMVNTKERKQDNRSARVWAHTDS